MLAVLALISVVLGLPGSNWGALLPAVIALCGGFLFLAGEAPPNWGGDGDPQRIVGGILFVAGVASALVVLAVAAVVRSVRRDRDRRKSERTARTC